MSTDIDHIVTGPVFDIAHDVLRDMPDYRRFRAQELDQSGWNRTIDHNRDRLIAAGFPAADIPFLKRIPADPNALVAEILADLNARAVLAQLPRYAPDTALLAHPDYIHGDKTTFIYPEEGELLACLVAELRPKRTVFLGSYYGFWARSALPILATHGGTAVLVDPDPEVAKLAQRNIPDAARGLVEIACMTGETYLDQAKDPFDLVVLDAELPRSEPDPTRRGKGLYYHLLARALPKLAPDAVLITHNILLNDWTGDPAFEATISRNKTELGPFMKLAEEHFGFIEYGTTEGVGIGRRRPDAGK